MLEDPWYTFKKDEFKLALARIEESKKNEDIIDIEYYLDLRNTKLTAYILKVLDKIQTYNAKIFRKRYKITN